MQAWGYLEYTKPLTEKEASDYELKPAPAAARTASIPEQSGPSSPKKKESVLEALHTQVESPKEKQAQKTTQKSHKKKEETR